MLLAFVALAYLLLWYYGVLRRRAIQKRPASPQTPAESQESLVADNTYVFPRSTQFKHILLQKKVLPSILTLPTIPVVDTTISVRARRWQRRMMVQMRLHWMLFPLMIIAAWLVFSTLTYEPYWQDELVSFYVSKNSIIHGFPMMPSGFIYPKAELFAYILGICMLIFGDQGAGPRLVSALEFIASIPLLYFVGCAFFGRRVAWLSATILTLSPFALVWGAQVRMYEQAQVCVLVVFYIFYKAARIPRHTRLPYIAVACLVVTYLSHEETFIILPGLVLCVLMISKERQLPLPAVLYCKHWWLASAAGACIIGIQLLIVHFSHPPLLGTDQSLRPDVQLNENGLPFYVTLLFSPKSTNAWLTINSVLATLGCVWAIFNKDMRLRYCVVFLIMAFIMLAFVFTLEADRYFYPLLPVYYLIGVYVLWKMLCSIGSFARACITVSLTEQYVEARAKRALSRPLRAMSVLTASMLWVSVCIAPMLPISNYNLGVSRLFGLTYHIHFSDYDAAGQYVQRHWQNGDILISISPDIEMFYYVGRSDYYFSIDRALFLIEQNGHIVNTSTAAIAILNQNDFNAILAKHTRIWLVSDHSQYEVSALKRFTFSSDFHVAFEGARDIVYLRGG